MPLRCVWKLRSSSILNRSPNWKHRSSLQSGHFSPRKRASRTYQIRGCRQLQSGNSCRESNSVRLASSLVKSTILPGRCVPLNIWLTLAVGFQNCRYAFPFLVLLPQAVTTVTWFSKYNHQILALQQHSVCCQDWESIYLSTVWRFISSLRIPRSWQCEFNKQSEVNRHVKLKHSRRTYSVVGVRHFRAWD